MQANNNFEQVKNIAKNLNSANVNYSTADAFINFVHENIDLIKGTMKLDLSLIRSLCELASKIDRVDPRSTPGSKLKETIETVHNLYSSHCMNIPDIRRHVFRSFPQGNKLVGPILSYYANTRLVCKDKTEDLEFQKTKTHKQLDAFKASGVKTSEEAIDYIIAHDLEVADLRNFKDVTDAQLKKLFSSGKKIDHLLISSAQNITKLPDECKNLQTLDCHNCSNLTTLPDRMEVATSLKLGFCKNITKLPNGMSELNKLHCQYCELTEIPEGMHRLKTFHGPGNRFTCLPEDMPNLKRLCCAQNPCLKAIPENLIKLEDLDISECPLLIEIPKKFSMLKHLTLINCHLITQIPKNYTDLKTLYCGYCVALTSLPETMPLLEILYADSSIALTCIPKSMGNLKELDCKNCPLQELPTEMTTLCTLKFPGHLAVPSDVPPYVNLQRT